MKSLPDAPPLTQNGNYEPSALRQFIDECEGTGLKAHQIAKILRVSIDRVEYLMGDGYRLVMRQRVPLARRAWSPPASGPKGSLYGDHADTGRGYPLHDPNFEHGTGLEMCGLAYMRDEPLAGRRQRNEHKSHGHCRGYRMLKLPRNP